MRYRLTLACIAVAALFALPVATSTAQSNIDSSEIDQYSEQVPTGGGDTPTKDTSSDGGSSAGAAVPTTGTATNATKTTSGSDVSGSSARDSGDESGDRLGSVGGDSEDVGEVGGSAADRAVGESALKAGVIPTSSEDDGGLGTIWLLIGAVFAAACLLYWLRQRRVS